MSRAACPPQLNTRITQLLFFSITAFSSFYVVSPQNTSLYLFHDFAQENLSLLGSSFIRQGDLELTLDSTVQSVTFSVGRALYKDRVRLRDPASNTTASWQTTFSFSIQSLTGTEAAGDGLAFIIVPDNTSIGSYGGWLGVLNDTMLLSKNTLRTLVVEFDTYNNSRFEDINANHVGINVDSMISTASVDAYAAANISLSKGLNLTAWIDYDAITKVLEVRLVQKSLTRPKHAILNATVDLSSLFNEYMYVGFSAATGSLVEVHTVYSWTFMSYGLPLAPPAPIWSAPPSNASPPLYRTMPPKAFSPSPGAFVMPVPGGVTKFTRCGGRSKLRCQIETLVAGIAIGIGVLLLLTSIVVLCIVHWKRRLELSSLSATGYDSESGNLICGPRKFTYKELSLATKEFSAPRLLGIGGSGSVYKGILPDDGALVAVKCISGDSKGKREFFIELSIISRLRHRNLVPLQGWCHGKGQLLLVYDYMPNGSLDKLLFGNPNECVLGWEQRYKIVTGVAAALAYLHEEWEQRVLHRDVKASNVMLDASFNARLGDFGLARLSEHNKSPETTAIVGTFGYMAPESTHLGALNEKSDVFSFGAVALEIVCGRRPIERGVAPEDIYLVDWVWGLRKKGKLLEAVDARLGKQPLHSSADEVLKVLQVGLLCSHPDPDTRPTMRQVIQILSGDAPMPRVPLSKPVPTYFATSPPERLHADIITEDHLLSNSTVSSS